MPVVLAQAWHSWKSARAVFALAVIALAVGIGSTTAIYTVVNAVMLKPLAYEHGERYGQLFSSTTVGNPDNRGSLMLADLLVYQHAHRLRPVRLVQAADVQPDLTRVSAARRRDRGDDQAGAQPRDSAALGHWFQDEHGAVISRALWMRLGGDPSLLGTAIV